MQKQKIQCVSIEKYKPNNTVLNENGFIFCKGKNPFCLKSKKGKKREKYLPLSAGRLNGSFTSFNKPCKE
jgi:hypothetical protein